MICKNCDNEFQGHYCNQCGQKANTHRIDFKHLSHDLLHAITHLDKGYIHTVREMLIRPGHTIREYLQGKRVSHPNPLLMLIIIGGLCSLTYYNLQIKLINAFHIQELDAGQHLIDSKFFSVLFVIYSLVLSALDYLFFKKRGYNYAELFVLNVFTSTQILLAQLSLVPLWLFGHALGINVYLRIVVGLVFLAYLVWVRYQFFEIPKYPRSKLILTIESVFIISIFLLISYRNFLEVFSS